MKKLQSWNMSFKKNLSMSKILKLQQHFAHIIPYCKSKVFVIESIIYGENNEPMHEMDPYIKYIS
jgi:hypothetical protein